MFAPSLWQSIALASMLSASAALYIAKPAPFPTSKAEAESCCNSPFYVQKGDTCSTYTNCCGGWASITCDKAGNTCTAESSALYTGDKCYFNWPAETDQANDALDLPGEPKLP